ncbi:DTW domain-containing protein [Gamsiella multidivaricata]|uniref:DTW domain-containing protein n=1 Tax=Gamsiella multidivaricata TaxID=101098 RepID=UPI00221F7EAA|nr:DTW domain-containing protein [Gamsiella multidivaricata]KAI7817333.1 DTW domain-containing protein [Gamsiella multidivaricata]
MILQHPRCQVSIGTIRILKMSFKYCQIVIGKDFKTGRSAELDQALGDPNCSPLLLYPSHSAVDIQTLAPEPSLPLPVAPSDGSNGTTQHAAQSRYFCQDCIHDQSADSTDMMNDANNPQSTSPTPYPYKLIIALDGSWSHAKIMYRCNPRLQQLAQIKFPNPPQSIYHGLKPEPKATYTSTAEAVGQAVALLGWPTVSGSAFAEDGSSTEAELLLEDLVRPLKKMIEIQDTIQDQQK